MDWKLIDKKVVYKGFLSIEEYTVSHDLYKGGHSIELKRQLMERGHAVAVLIFDPAEDKLILIEQFRIGAKDIKSPWLTELVAGMIEDGESADDVVERECYEEAGVKLDNYRPLFTYYSSPGGCSEKITLYYAEADSSKAGGIHGLASEQEDIKVKVVAYQQAVDMLSKGIINSATPILAMQWLQLHHDEIIAKYNAS